MISSNQSTVKSNISISDKSSERAAIQINRKILARATVDRTAKENLNDLLDQGCNKVENWETTNVSVKELAEAIALGFTVRPGIKEGGNIKENVKSSQWIMLDFDETPLATTLKNGLIQYACMYYFTASYEDGVNEKHRLVFRLDRPVIISEHEFLYSRIKEQFQKADNIQDAGRLLFGASHPDNVKILNEKAVLIVDTWINGYEEWIKENLVTRISQDRTDEDGVTVKVYQYLHDEIFVKKLDCDIRRLYCLYDHKWKWRSPDKRGMIAKYEGRNPYSSTNSSGASFVVSYTGDTLPPFWSRSEETTDKGFIEYWFKIKGHGYSGNLEKNFKKVVHDICDHFGVVKFDFRTTKKKATEEDELCKFQQLYNLTKEKMGDRLRFNEMLQDVEIDGVKIRWDNIRHQFTQITNKDTSTSIATEIVLTLAWEDSYHPVRDYFKSLEYNGYSLDDISQKLLGTTDPLYDLMLKRTLIAAVARTFKPGCQVDTVCVLQGIQGLGKTTFWSMLAGEEWFTSSVANGSSDKDDKALFTKFLLLELGELEGIFKRKDINGMRGFITDKTDTYRKPYSKDYLSIKRSSIFVASVNPKQFLRDPEGNRRYWTIPVERMIDLEIVEKNRDSIWASAVHLYNQHLEFISNGGKGKESPFRWWFNEVEDKVNDTNNEEFMDEDDLQDLVMPIARRFSRIQIMDLILALGFDKEDRSVVTRIGHIFQSYKWKKAKITISPNERKYCYLNPEKEYNGRKLEPYYLGAEKTVGLTNPVF